MIPWAAARPDFFGGGEMQVRQFFEDFRIIDGGVVVGRFLALIS
jgi:hypothetical protein